MIRDILGILSDFVGIIFVWWHPESLAWYYKLIISVVLISIAIVFHFISKNRPTSNVTDYLLEENNRITLILNKNIYYSIDMLVSIYMRDENRSILCAIGYVKSDPEDKKLHIQVVHNIDIKTMEKIRQSSKSYKRFFVKPFVTQNDISKVEW